MWVASSRKTTPSDTAESGSKRALEESPSQEVAALSKRPRGGTLIVERGVDLGDKMFLEHTPVTVEFVPRARGKVRRILDSFAL